jgi:radical SAM superfamily enzyme YgiQ (UPF0313 family)
MDKIKIYFYGPNDIIPATKDKTILTLYYNTVPLYLDAHIRYTKPELHAKIEWSTITILEKTQDQLVQELNAQDIDVLCVSLYSWNVNEVLTGIRGIKNKLNRPITVVAGGPSVDIYRDREFLHKNPDIDFAIYTQGEQAFVDVLESKLAGKQLNTLNTKNLAWINPRNNQLKMSDFEFVRNNDGSPYLESQDLLLRMKNDPAHHGLVMILPYETGRGCPYGCTFCDWTSGLTHKVSKRNFNYTEELEFLGRNDVTFLQMSDANFGIQKRDIEIARIMARLKKEQGYNFRIYGTNFSKLKKDVVFEIVDILMDAKILMAPKFALQDIDPVVLKNIDRPDIPWPEHKAHIQKLEAKYPGMPVRIELIGGLPGQTVESFEHMLAAIHPYELEMFPLMVLANSPIGYDMEYREKMQIKTMHTNLIYPRSLAEGGYNLEVVCETYSYSFDDFVYFMLLMFILKHPTNHVKKLLGIFPNLMDFFKYVKKKRNFDNIQTVIRNCLLTSTCELIQPAVNIFMEEPTQ